MKNQMLNDSLGQLFSPDYVDNDMALVDDVRQVPFGNDIEALDNVTIIVFVRTGYMHVIINGEIYHVSPKNVIVCRPGHHFSNPSYSEDFSGHAILLTPRYGHSIISVTGNIWKILLSIDSSPILELPESVRPRLRSYYTLIIEEVNDKKNIYHKEVVSSIIKAMLYSLISELRQVVKVDEIPIKENETEYVGSSQALSLFHKFIEILITERCTKRKIDYYAKRLCVTPKYLSTVCKQVSNRTAHEWICDAIVSSIDNCLRYSDMSIKEIAMQFGFTTLSFFSKFVKEHLGQPPSAFRKQISERIIEEESV